MRSRDVLFWMILNDLPVEPGARTAYTIEIPAARDPAAPRPSLLTRERLQRAAQLGENVGLEIAREEAPLDTEALEELYHSIQNLHQRLSLYFKPKS